MIARQLLSFELVALLQPGELCLDPYELLTGRGNLLFQNFFMPSVGRACEKLDKYGLKKDKNGPGDRLRYKVSLSEEELLQLRNLRHAFNNL